MHLRLAVVALLASLAAPAHGEPVETSDATPGQVAPGLPTLDNASLPERIAAAVLGQAPAVPSEDPAGVGVPANGGPTAGDPTPGDLTPGDPAAGDPALGPPEQSPGPPVLPLDPLGLLDKLPGLTVHVTPGGPPVLLTAPSGSNRSVTAVPAAEPLLAGGRPAEEPWLQPTLDATATGPPLPRQAVEEGAPAPSSAAQEDHRDTPRPPWPLAAATVVGLLQIALLWKVATLLAARHRRGGLRAQIVEQVRREPGTRYSDLVPLANGHGAIEHHVHALVREGVLVRHTRAGSTFYTLPGADVDAARCHALVRGSARRIVDELACRPDARMADIARRLDLARQTIHYHVNKLVEAGVLLDRRGGRALVLSPPAAAWLQGLEYQGPQRAAR